MCYCDPAVKSDWDGLELAWVQPQGLDKHLVNYTDDDAQQQSVEIVTPLAMRLVGWLVGEYCLLREDSYT